MAGMEIVRVRSEKELADVAILFTTYTTWLNIDLAFQDFATELADLPGKYAPPTGELLLAREAATDEPLGCIALRPLLSQTATSSKTCELKRLYVVSAARGTGAGKALVAQALKISRELGYTEAKLDTLPHMQSAIKTYEKFGFVECEKYYDTPLEGTKFMRLDLTC